ncbi:uncharacterized protein DUF3223|uniref:Uncharacterized protein DUF3223 n=1 Tax=Brenneria salicis ATCC 15712 = DSM 30166 TaxID=714314 RepID=A0A366I0U6_9GAMM|nr:DCL family protein [Brenneria salicis]NMN92915.1 uncharacterized protein DUF3223 [Brenneria salicis ATCC 15712 = DSM 30166]RBP60966.1 uncharacterized protein DUF3223 [Brenneria salicis ATCC 15712 = DSM 30166]
MAKPIVFGSYHFKTKASATEEARRRINVYEAGERLKLDDEHFFNLLFTLHPQYLEKKGVGIDHIKVERDFHNHRCLYIHRIDNTTTDCSWVQCIRPASQKTIVSMAFRRAVKETVMAYKREKLNVEQVCPVFGIRLTYENSHVSYLSPSFEKLLNDFLYACSLDIDGISLNNPKPEDADQRGLISNPILLKEWRDYHQRNVTLELISAEANLRKLKNND